MTTPTPWSLRTIAESDRMTWLRLEIDDGKHGRMESTDLIELRNADGEPDMLVIGGDRAPGRGVTAQYGYGFAWLARCHKSEDYICSKFLPTDWHAALAVEGLRSNAAQIKAEAEAEKHPNGGELEIMRLLALADEVERGEAGPVAVGDLWTDIYGDSDGMPGYGYNPNSRAVLVDIATRFARLWEERA